MKQRLRAAVVVAVVTGPALLSAGVARAAAPAPGTLEIRGRGNGHGVGLPQDGALALGRAGKTAAEILETFYPGTTLARATSAHMHVAVWQEPVAPGTSPGRPPTKGSRNSTEIVLPQGGHIVGPLRAMTILPGGHVTLTDVGPHWTATLSGPVAGSGGRSVPRRVRADDPAPGGPASVDGAPADGPSDGPSGGAPSDGPSDGAPSNGSSDGAPTDGPTDGAPTATQSPGHGRGTPSPQSSPAPGEPAPGSGPGTGAAASGGSPGASGVPSEGSASPQRSPGSASPDRDGASRSPSPSGSDASETIEGTELVVVPGGTGGVVDLPATGRSYRGHLVTASRELVNDVPLESYLRGLGEVLDPSWPSAGLQALVVAARTYALRDALQADDPTDPQHVNICATDACQVYLGAGVEYPRLDAAVASTARTVVTYQGALAATYYSASSGGETASPAEGFGAASAAVPYLVPVAYDDGGHDGWQRTLTLGSAAAALGYPGTLSGLEVTERGPSGRATTVAAHGSAGDRPFAGLAVAAALQLPSTLFETGAGVAAPLIDQALSLTPLPVLKAAQVGAAAPVIAVPIPIIAPDGGSGQPDAPTSGEPMAALPAGLAAMLTPAATQPETGPGRPLALHLSGPASPRVGSVEAGPVAIGFAAMVALGAVALGAVGPRRSGFRRRAGLRRRRAAHRA